MTRRAERCGLSRCSMPPSTYFLCVDLAGFGDRPRRRELRRRRPSNRPASRSFRCPPSPSSDPSRHLVRLCFGKKDETIDAGVAAMAKAQRRCSHEPGRRSRPRSSTCSGSTCARASWSAIRRSTASAIGRVTTGDPDAAAGAGRRGLPRLADGSGAATRRAGSAARRAAARGQAGPGQADHARSAARSSRRASAKSRR